MAPIDHILPDTEILKLNKPGRKERLQEERPGLGEDGFFISEEGKQLQQRQRAIEVAEQEVGRVPAIRADLVAQIKEKLAEGEYLHLSEGIAGAIAEGIVDGLYLNY